MAQLIDFIMNNLWVSYISFFIWILLVIYMIKRDIGILRGRGDYKDKNGKFEHRGITFIKIFTCGIILIFSALLSVPLITIFPNIIKVIIFVLMVIIIIVVFIPLGLVKKGSGSDIGLRWLINLIDKWDSAKK